MSTWTILLTDKDKETAIRLFFDALHVSYEVSEIGLDETQYLSDSPNMKAHLEKAAQQEKNGEGVTISLDDIWK